MTPPLPDLPVRSVLPELRHALAAGRDAILVAPPGSGKTTLVPLALKDEPWLRGRRILMLEPRRMATRAAAWRMSDLLGEEVGGPVGYHIRLERRESARTRVLVLTEGLLTRRLLGDPELAEAGLVVFDEFHERSLHADLAFALCRDIQRSIRPDLRILVTSATLDADALARHLDAPAVLEAQGRQYPVDTRFAPRPSHEPVPFQVARVCLRALSECPGSVLAFLPGEGEIRTAARWLTESSDRPADLDIHALYGALPKDEQDAALRPAPPGRRKLVLATAIAESSLTIDGVNTVVDSGWMRVSRFSPATGMERLETLRVSRDRADQRRGRAGRLAPGVCYRLWDESADRNLAPTAQPEILTADLAPLALVVADWGATSPDALPWVTPPPAAAWEQATALLRSLDALDHAGRITAQGRRMVQLPMHPRLAHMVLRAAEQDTTADACLVAAALAERVSAEAADGGRTTSVDELLDAVRRGRHGHVLALAREWQRSAALRSAARGAAPADRRGLASQSEGFLAAPDAGPLLATAYPDRVARRRGPRGERRYLLACGRGGTLRLDDPLAAHEWLAVAELDDADSDAAIRLAAPLRAEDVAALFAGQVARRAVLDWDRRTRRVVASEVECLGAITLRERPLADADPESLVRCLCDGIRSEGLERLGWTPSARQLQARIAFVRRSFPEKDWPDVDDAALAAGLGDWLGPMLAGRRSLDEAARVDLCEALSAWLGPRRARELERLAPSHVEVPSGSRIRLDYAAGETPALAVRIQEVFGMQASPRVADGRVPVLLRLLSPAQRPVQVTSDLASFWRTGYAEVRKELRGRYPKHYWPEDPSVAEPTRRVRPR